MNIWLSLLNKMKYLIKHSSNNNNNNNNNSNAGWMTVIKPNRILNIVLFSIVNIESLIITFDRSIIQSINQSIVAWCYIVPLPFISFQIVGHTIDQSIDQSKSKIWMLIDQLINEKKIHLQNHLVNFDSFIMLLS